jgi:hypothetical protein
MAGQRESCEQGAMQHRRRIKHEISFEQRIAKLAQRVREEADRLPPGDKEKREALLKKIGQAEIALSICAWLNSAEPRSSA